MAGWLSSKLKEAEHFLQQIDQQAAESLGKPEIQKPNERGGRRGKTKPTADFLYTDHKDGNKEASAQRKVDLGLEATPLALSKLVRKSDQGPRAVHGYARVEGKDTSLNKKLQPGPIVQITGESEINGKDDWTELLATPNVEPYLTPALVSSVGSSDSARYGYVKGHPSRTTINRNKIGGYHRRSDDFSLEKSSAAKQESAFASKISSSTIFPTTGSVISSRTTSPGKLGHAALPRRLELDLAELVCAETEKNNEALVTATSHETGMIGNSMDFNQAGIERNTDFEHSRKNSEVLLIESVKEDAASKAQPSEIHADGLSNLQEQDGTIPDIASDSIDYLADVNGTAVVPADYQHNESKGIGHTLEDSFNRVHAIEKQSNAIQSLVKENGGNVATDTHQVIECRDLTGAHEMGISESLPVTQALPSSLNLDDGSHDSSAISDGDSDRDTESEDEEDEEMERRKFAHKKRIARRKELTASRAAAAQEAIRERKLFVEKLEKESINLKRVLADREEQQGREAAELRTTIAEVMHALETEKKLHSSIRMKALAAESQLENKNADLAKSLGALQWQLDEQTSQLLKARNMVNSKESAKEELVRRLAKMRGDLYGEQNREPKLVEKSNEDGSFEEEQSDLWKKIQQCQIQVKDLEVKIHGLKDTPSEPTETEQELETRLAQMTDYLIQRQSQVEALATEKATLLIRLEALSNKINEERAMVSKASRNKPGVWTSSDGDSNYYDMEYGLGIPYDSKKKHSAYELGESSSTNTSLGSVPLSPILRQLNVFFSVGMFYLRKHRWARVFAIMYIIILHLWVWFVVSKPTQTLTIQEFGLPKNVSDFKDGSNVTNLL